MMRWPFSRRAESGTERIDPQAAYALWATNYPPRAHNRLMEIEQSTVLGLLPAVTGLTVLDAGCGTGRYSGQLQARSATAVGVDLSLPMLERARKVISRVVRADLRALPCSAMSVDHVICGLALGDVPELELALAEAARVLRPGGRLIYSVVHPGGEAAGWSRTFETDGRRMAIDSFWHSLDAHRESCAAAGLTIESWCEPVLPEAPTQPAVLVVRARR
jgi:malonyl-CoA O-methyltransferase